MNSSFYTKEKCLKGKTILVTGAGRGIGRESALAFAKQGAQVILVGQLIKYLNETYKLIINTYPDAPLPIVFPFDFTYARPEQYHHIESHLRNKCKKLDGLVHSAEVCARNAAFKDINSQQWIKLLQANVSAPLYLTQCLLPLLQDSQSASIVFTTSRTAEEISPDCGTHIISKKAQLGMMELLSVELAGSPIRVNAVNAGETNVSFQLGEEHADDLVSVNDPAIVTPAYVYLMAEESIDVHGEVLKIA